MTSEPAFLKSAVSEYRCVASSRTLDASGQMDTERLVRDISCKHDWTEYGARTIVTLANEYGAFMLRNALALAIALNKEDGDLGF